MNSKKNLNFILLFLLIIILSEKTNFFRSVYDILTIKYHERLLKKYDYCDGTGLGYILNLKKKYNISQINPEVVNYGTKPAPKWIFYNTSVAINKNYKIFLNYKPYLVQKFFKKNDSFISTDAVYEIDKISNIVFKIDKNFKSFSGYLSFYNQNENDILLIKKIKFNKTDFENNNLLVNFSNEKLSRKMKNSTAIDPGPLVVKFNVKNNEMKDIKQINVYFDMSNDIKNYQILHQDKDCFYTKKND